MAFIHSPLQKPIRNFETDNHYQMTANNTHRMAVMGLGGVVEAVAGSNSLP